MKGKREKRVFFVGSGVLIVLLASWWPFAIAANETYFRQGELRYIELGSRTVVVEVPSGSQMFTVGGRLSDNAVLKRRGARAHLEDLAIGDVVRVGWKKTETGHFIELIEIISSYAKPPAKRKTIDIAERTIIGAPKRHIVGKKETLLDIARLYGLGFNEIQDLYPLLDPWIPPEGTELIIPSQWILPDASVDGILINVAELRLYYLKGKHHEVKTFPIGIGDHGYTTPLGIFRIGEKRVKPTWYIPPSLQKKYSVKSFPPGPENPLGDYWLGIGNSYGIHGTDIPWSVGRLVTHGCIRLYPEDIERLFRMVKTGTPVKIIYEPVKIGFLSGKIYVEVHRDIYGRIGDFMNYGHLRLAREGITHAVDLDKFRQALARQDGMPVEITLPGP